MEYKVIEKENVTLYTDEPIMVRNKSTGLIGRLTMDIDECPESPREWDNVTTIVSRGGNWDISDKGWRMNAEEFAEFLHKKLDKKCPEIKGLKDIDYIVNCGSVKDYIVCKPIYMYEHSGQTISLSPFGCPWDSGLCGYVFVFKDKILKEFPDTNDDNWRDKAEEVIESEIDVYDSYIQGEVYYYCLEEGHTVEHKDLVTGAIWTSTEYEVVDSCCGYYGDCRLDILYAALGDDWEVIEEIKEDK
jgi:hypothetical protein